MGLPVYVVNFDELAGQIAVEGVTVEIDTSEIERILERFFPELIGLLGTPSGTQEFTGTQKMKGFVSTGETVIFVPEKDIALTGVSFSQSIFDGGCTGKWSLKVANGGAEITLLDGVYAKDALQHKYFERFYPVPAGYQIVMAPSSSGKTYWIDLEYLELVNNEPA